MQSILRGQDARIVAGNNVDQVVGVDRDRNGIGVWPKKQPELTPRQREILEDWYGYWLSLVPNRYPSVARFGHNYSQRSTSHATRTLEIGAGDGEHLLYERLESQEYFALELRSELADRMRSRFHDVTVVVGDCQQRLEFPDRFFDRIIAIHILEHLVNLPAALDEVGRVLAQHGRFSVVIPCEGGFAYNLGRWLTSKRIFEKRYGVPYDWIVSYDHVNCAAEVLDELSARFAIEDQTYFPLGVPAVHANLVVGLTLRHK